MNLRQLFIIAIICSITLTVFPWIYQDHFAASLGHSFVGRVMSDVTDFFVLLQMPAFFLSIMLSSALGVAAPNFHSNGSTAYSVLEMGVNLVILMVVIFPSLSAVRGIVRFMRQHRRTSDAQFRGKFSEE